MLIIALVLVELRLFSSLIYFISVPFENEDRVNLFTKSNKITIEKFRSLIGDVLLTEFENTDDYLIKWLHATEMNVNDAATRFREYKKWRKDNRMDSIVNETIFEFNPPVYKMEGYDKEGYPLLLTTSADMDVRKFIIQSTKEKLLRYFYQMIEIGKNVIIKTPKGLDGKNITRFVLIQDLHGFNLKQHFCFQCISIYKEMFTILEKYYPDSAQRYIFINAPNLGKQAVEIIRPLLSPANQKAIKVFGLNRNEWSSYLLKIISADQLPYRFGGTKTSV